MNNLNSNVPLEQGRTITYRVQSARVQRKKFTPLTLVRGHLEYNCHVVSFSTRHWYAGLSPDGQGTWSIWDMKEKLRTFFFQPEKGRRKFNCHLQLLIGKM